MDDLSTELSDLEARIDEETEGGYSNVRNWLNELSEQIAEGTRTVDNVTAMLVLAKIDLTKLEQLTIKDVVDLAEQVCQLIDT